MARGLQATCGPPDYIMRPIGKLAEKYKAQMDSLVVEFETTNEVPKLQELRNHSSISSVRHLLQKLIQHQEGYTVGAAGPTSKL